jgi:hypothetical protein
MKNKKIIPVVLSKHFFSCFFYAFLFLVSFQLILAGCKKDTSVFAESAPNDFLSGKHYSSLVVEIQYVRGFRPSTQTLNNLNAFLQSRLNKPGGITFAIDSISSPGKTLYSLDDAVAIENANRSQSKSGTRMAAYFLFADGDYASNPSNGKVLGITYGLSSVIIFEKTIKDYSGGLGQPQVPVLESSVTEHEFGHMLGLVNNGTQMQTNHQDAANGRHCNNQNCLMYYNIETSNVVANLLGGNIPQLDANCLNDLRSNGGK